MAGVTDHRLIEDRVMVGLSGSKDSWALIRILDVCGGPIDFSQSPSTSIRATGLRAPQADRDLPARGWELRVEHTNIGETIEDILEVDATPCSLCAAPPRRALPSGEDRRRDQDRARITPTISSRRCSSTSSGLAKGDAGPLVSDNGEHVSSALASSSSRARAYARASELPIIGCCCPACGGLAAASESSA